MSTTITITTTKNKQPRGVSGAVMRKEGIHPEWHAEAKVICNGVEVMTVGGTKPTYNVDIYSGNHPWWQSGSGSVIVTDEGQLNKFKRRFAGLEELADVSAAAAGKPPTKEELKAAGAKVGGGGKAGGKGAKRR